MGNPRTIPAPLPLCAQTSARRYRENPFFRSNWVIDHFIWTASRLNFRHQTVVRVALAAAAGKTSSNKSKKGSSPARRVAGFHFNGDGSRVVARKTRCAPPAVERATQSGGSGAEDRIHLAAHILCEARPFPVGSARRYRWRHQAKRSAFSSSGLCLACEISLPISSSGPTSPKS